ncbi:Coatomer beta subunit [Parasponia andersonii]|uniref:Coatomer beta subunit n=1 Tax=Parasponia andersonii TaxID=3476 RepID=A0A2P5DJV8_PARAD|nr:Coatomer beta subunit [Parasponia andersonii]
MSRDLRSHGLRANLSSEKMNHFSDEREDQFYDACEDLASVSDWDEDCAEDFSSSISGRLRYEFWAKNPDGVLERRRKFLKWMGVRLDRDSISMEDTRDVFPDKIGLDIDRITETSGAVLRSSSSKEGLSSSESRMSSSLNGTPELLESGALLENFLCEVRNSNSRSEFAQGELVQNRMFGRFSIAGSGRFISSEEFQRNHRPSPSVQPSRQRKVEDAGYLFHVKKKVKRGWLRKLGIGMCVVDKMGDAALNPRPLGATMGTGMQRVQVHLYKKRTRELSSLFAGQEFQAHEGSILTMKFSLDGHYLASAGEDGIVRVWKVSEDERSSKFDIAGDPSSQCFTIDNVSKLAHLDMDKEKLSKLRKSSDSASAIFPPKVFNLLDKPLHEFRGHSGEVLDLSWSSKGFLLSSSIDKTVRLWQVGCDRCLRVFCHNNYVTCVDFKPLDDNHFISGSIDGKVRIWEVRRCRVVDYIDIREIVTAVSYRPDGKGGIVGSMTGNCLSYNIIDNRLQLDAQICLQGKKKSPGKRITGFQFTPDDPSKVMVTSADSLVRILCGNNVICKFKGLRNAASQMSASFTSDGKHIVSATEDSNVYIWNYTSQDKTSSRTKNIWSSESFLSHNASIAVPWCGSKVIPDTIPPPTLVGDTRRDGLENGQKHNNFDEHLEQKMPLSSPDCFSFSGFLESLPRGSATWPEEKLVNSSPMAVSPSMRLSKFKFLRSALQSMSGSPHMWGLVVVTAGWDGRIRTFLNYGLPICV